MVVEVRCVCFLCCAILLYVHNSPSNICWGSLSFPEWVTLTCTDKLLLPTPRRVRLQYIRQHVGYLEAVSWKLKTEDTVDGAVVHFL